jgi:hypothetical protein
MAADNGVLGGGSDGDAVAASLIDPAQFAVIFDRHYEEIWSYLSRARNTLAAALLPGPSLPSASWARWPLSPSGSSWPSRYGVARPSHRRRPRSSSRAPRALPRRPPDRGG